MIKLRLNDYKDSIIAFFVLGIPFFLEFSLTLFFPEDNHKLFVCDPNYVPVKLFQIATVFATFFISFVLVKFKRTMLVVWIFLFYVPAITDLVAIYITGTHISYDFMLSIFNTYPREIFLLVKQYVFFVTINLFFIVSIFFLQMRHSYLRFPHLSSFRKKIYEICSLGLFIAAFAISRLLPFYNISDAFIDYLADSEEAREYSVSRVPMSGIKSVEGKQTYVFVIGESVDKKHMQIYGYNRETTPHFSNLKNDLFVFKNVNTSSVFTSGAVKAMLQFRDKNNKQLSLIHFFKDAGFKTFWFSNQGQMNIFDNSVVRIGRLCDEYAFIHAVHTKNITFSSENYNFKEKDKDENAERRSMLLDENLLPYVEKALKDQADKKVIFVHLVGSHAPMDARYPSEFAKFALPKQYYDKFKALCVCHYDNSILYTDWILSKIIQLLQEEKTISWLLYLSDHGQDVFDNADCRITARTWPNSYEVPFIVWISEKYRRKNANFVSNWNTDAYFVTDQTAYSIIDLARMKHADINLSKSIFSKKHSEKIK